MREAGWDGKARRNLPRAVLPRCCTSHVHVHVGVVGLLCAPSIKRRDAAALLPANEKVRVSAVPVLAAPWPCGPCPTVRRP